MKFINTGLILCTEKYEDCVDFYANKIGLSILHSYDNEHSKLTALDMGGNSYLMVEPGGKAIPEGKTIDDNPVWIRFNVENIDAAVTELRDRGVTAKIRREVWGTVADFCDPDGNICSLREAGSF